MISINEARDERQIEIIEKMAESIWNEHYTPIIGKEQVEYMLASFQNSEAIKKQINEGYRYFILYFQNEPAGYFAIQPDLKDKSMFLSKLYIRKDFRGNGLSHKCLEYIQEICRDLGLRKIWLTVNKRNENSIKIYKKLGFENKKSIIQDIGNGFVMDDYLMEKKLTSD